MAEKSKKESNYLLETAAGLRELVALNREDLAAARCAQGGLLVSPLEARQKQTEEIAERALELTSWCADILERVAPDFLGDPELRKSIYMSLRALRARSLAAQGSLGGKQSARKRAAIKKATIERAVAAYLTLDADPNYAKDPFPVPDIERVAGLEQGELRKRKITRKSIKKLADQRKIRR